MTRRCPKCGVELRVNSRFCPACGQAIDPNTFVPQAESVPSSKPILVIRVAGQPQREATLDRPVMTMGRAPDNDIILMHGYVSAHHGRFERHGAEWRYVDLGSTNGTFINGQLQEATVLQSGDVLRIGDVQGNSVGLTFRSTATSGISVYEQIVPRRAIGAPAASEHAGTQLLDVAATVMIGRDQEAEITLDAPVVSRYHARIEQTAQGHLLTDLNSTNGTFVNGERLTSPHRLTEGDVVQIGPYRLVYEAGALQQYVAKGGVRLDGLHVSREVGSRERRKRILNDISLSVYPREFIALVGTSGAGKSTLMKALSGVARAQEGQILVNGDSLYQQFDLYRTMIGYVPQDDILHRELKVADALRYSAQLRLPPDTSSEEIERRIERVLEEVEMLAQKDQVISSLSGGQRKRVSIASELLAEPRLFFLDEPTSGLDPGLEKKMMYLLRRLADGGRTIVLVTHATANITQCDQVCFLTQGRMAYYGPPEQTFDFFGVDTDDYSDVYDCLDDVNPDAARRKATQWEETYRRSPEYEQFVLGRQRRLSEAEPGAVESVERHGPRVNPLRQLSVLTRRYLELVLRDKLLLAVLIAVMPIVGALIVLISKPHWLVGNTAAEIEQQLSAELATGAVSATYSVARNAESLIFMLAFAAVLLGIFASVYEIVKEWSVYQRERMVTLRLAPYFLSKILVLGGSALLQCLLLLVVVGLRVDYPTEGLLLPAPLEMYVTLCLGTFAAVAMGLAISTLVPNVNTVIYVVLVVLMFQMIFGGVIFELPGVAEELSSLTLVRWTMEGLGSSVGMDRLNAMTLMRIQPDPFTQEVALEVSRPADDWEPVTVITTTQEIAIEVQPGVVQTVPVAVPEVTVHDLVTVTETLTESFTVEPDPTDVATAWRFGIDYDRTTAHLLKSWGILAGYSAFFGALSLVVLKRKDIR
jgi:ABC transport system ATP-binding/permease protein